MSALTQDLGRFVAALSLPQIPPEDCAIARTGIADCFGVLIAGSRDPEIALVDRELGHSHGPAVASLIPSGDRRSVDTAALVNGVAAHVLDYDDVSLDGHPSVVLVPAILALTAWGDRWAPTTTPSSGTCSASTPTASPSSAPPA